MHRIKWVDVSKGITIILIVFGHVLRVGYVRDVLYCFHVPVFFFLSGITATETFSVKRIVSDTKRILVPYYAFGAISIAVYAVLGAVAASKLDTGETSSIWQNVLSLLYGSSILPFNAPLWFLPCLFATKTLHPLLYRLVRGKHWLLIGVAFAGSIVGFLYSKANLIALPFSFELLLKLYPFFLIGRFLSGFLTDLGQKFSGKRRALLIASLLLMMTVLLGGIAPPVNYTNSDFPIPSLFYLIACIGGGGVYFLSVYLENVKWISWLGQNTMPILLMHKFPIVLLQVVGPFAEWISRPDSLSGLVIGAIPVTAISIIASLVVGKIIECFFPILIGTRKYKRK